MLSEFKPKGFSEAAQELGVDLFELVRILSNTEGVPQRLAFESTQIKKIAKDAGIEASWWTDVDLPKDHNVRRQRVRAALHLLLDRHHIGGPGTRMDNVWRGLSPDDQALVSDALNALAEDELAVILNSPLGSHIYIPVTAKERVAEIAGGKSDTAALSALYEE